MSAVPGPKATASKPVKPAPAWAEAKAAPAPKPRAAREPLPALPPMADRDEDDEANGTRRKSKYAPAPRTGREPGMTTIFLNVGRKQLVTPADIVGKIAGVARLPASVVGAIDIHQRHTLADVAETEAATIVKKLAGVPLKGVPLAPSLAGAGTQP
jgi:ATP-dependent RNA helicase DeaD